MLVEVSLSFPSTSMPSFTSFVRTLYTYQVSIMRLLMDMTTPWWSWNELDFLIMSVRSHFRQYVTFNRALPLLLDIVFFFLDGTHVPMTTSPHSTQARKRFDSGSVLMEGGRGEFVFVERGFRGSRSYTGDCACYPSRAIRSEHYISQKLWYAR